MSFNDVLRLSHRTRMLNNDIINVFHFKELSLLAVGNNSQTLATDFRDNIGPVWRPYCTPDISFQDVTVQRIIPFGDAPVTVAYATNTLGNMAGSTLGTSAPAALVFTITWYTGQAGRSKRGRTYLSGQSINFIGTGVLNASGTTILTNLRDAIFNRYVTNAVGGTVNWRLGVWSRKLGGDLPPFSTDGFAPVTSSRVNTVARIQRRREVGVGR
jgi:hypothetical protein